VIAEALETIRRFVLGPARTPGPSFIKLDQDAVDRRARIHPATTVRRIAPARFDQVAKHRSAGPGSAITRRPDIDLDAVDGRTE